MERRWLEKLEAVERRYEELTAMLADPAVATDISRLRTLSQEREELEPVVEAFRRYQAASRQLEDARQLLETAEDEELAALAREEMERLSEEQERLEQEILRLLLPRDPNDEKNVIMEIRAGAGGEEAALFAADLFRMYSRYAERKGWGVELLSANETGLGGFKEVIFLIRGRGAYSRLKYESGVHRVQRVPITEASGRIHTSTATVAVLPEMDEVEVQIDPKDIVIETFRAGTAGGQHMQKNETAVRITHIPTGIVVSCQDERSQFQNKQRALTILRARLYELERRKREAEVSQARRLQVGTAERAEKIRTYNFPQNRVTDHRINLSLYRLQEILDGDLDPLIEALIIEDQTRRMAEEEAVR
ncbi:peptide chain release factor 1 [Thermoflexus sp.]|uniref:peptide chain release factor 1 n=1 Tax=Thermoflexus sp. TaxID=1969742 RepID=UPI0025CF1F9D|nr:peptide chain release factor 1 [Thermoflexus sp.]MDW8181582.1 peptide chain release factor 1 [Anaerolineae bacterium]MCS6965104.1 peptide chain release factor 1 [Thermoflexus sp.]MCS7352123.1 peptide chain release factor 1 [Thermoflexus sp.]MCX7691705.1 peptide chain release factor 1 [Thermoflexus sp.]MDW8186147.1 peptide chain release factor 1 [Anaerolineae bacterium]